MAQGCSGQREALRQRLLTWALSGDVTSEETLSEQIEHLLEDVLHEQEDVTLPQTLPQLLDDRPEDQRVVVTGMGLVTPFGIGVEPFWAGLEAGASAIARITLCDPAAFPCQIAGEVRGFQAQAFLEAREARHMSRSSQFAVAAARLALSDADLIVNEDNRDEIGVLLGCGSSSLPETELAIRTLIQRGPADISPLYIATALPHIPACQVALQLGLRGSTSSISTDAAAGAQSIGEAAAIIRRGDALVMLAGGTDASISQAALGGFCAMGALSTQNDNPPAASRPFDAQRDGFVPGEGAGLLVLEQLAHARRRGASIYAEVLGYASTCDAYSITAPDPHGDGAAQAMRRALQTARIGPQQIDYINAHAMSTPAGDIVETLAIKQVFGEYASIVPVSATKSMIGHLLAAAGAVEAAATILALQQSVLPPTINQEYPDPDCDLDYVPNLARPAAIQTAMSNSFGFGGINAVLIFRRWDDNE